jgi:hypothetical protein
MPAIARPDEPRTIDEDEAHQVLDACDDDQVRAWARRYAVDEAEIRKACETVGGHRTAVELWLGEARP